MAKGRKQQAEFIRMRARELANSGDHENHQDVEFALRVEGYLEARSVLDDSFVREDLDKMCKFAREKKKEGQR